MGNSDFVCDFRLGLCQTRGFFTEIRSFASTSFRKRRTEDNPRSTEARPPERLDRESCTVKYHPISPAHEEKTCYLRHYLPCMMNHIFCFAAILRTPENKGKEKHGEYFTDHTSLGFSCSDFICLRMLQIKNLFLGFQNVLLHFKRLATSIQSFVPRADSNFVEPKEVRV